MAQKNDLYNVMGRQTNAKELFAAAKRSPRGVADYLRMLARKFGPDWRENETRTDWRDIARQLEREAKQK